MKDNLAYYSVGRGPDVTITRANIEAENFARVKEGKPPFTAEGVVDAFVWMPEPRHYKRAHQLMSKREAA